MEEGTEIGLSKARRRGFKNISARPEILIQLDSVGFSCSAVGFQHQSH